MITLTERLVAIQIEMGVQQLIIQTTLLTTLDDMIKNGGTEKTRKVLRDALIEIKEFSERIDKKLSAITEKGPTDGI